MAQKVTTSNNQNYVANLVNSLIKNSTPVRVSKALVNALSGWGSDIANIIGNNKSSSTKNTNTTTSPLANASLVGVNAMSANPANSEYLTEGKPLGLTYDEYLIYKSYLPQLQSLYGIIDQNVAAQKGILDNNLATNKALLEAETSLQKADLDEAYEKNVQAVDVQRRLNERYLERKAAEMGLTDSGLNRTQLTANQLSAGNAINDYGVQRQKAIDSLDAAMKAQMLQYTTNYNNEVAALDLNAENQKAEAKLGYIDSAKTQYAANQKAKSEAQSKAAEKIETARKNAYNDISNEIEALDRDDDNDRKSAAKIIEEFLMKYDPDGEFGYGNRLLNLAKMTEQDFKDLITYGYTQSTPWYNIDSKNLFKKRT
jgi:hypothetical protein